MTSRRCGKMTKLKKPKNDYFEDMEKLRSRISRKMTTSNLV